jgi:DNA-binding MarR family transcriptional regulator
MDFSLQQFLPFRLNRLAAEVSRRLSVVYAERFDLDIPEWRVLATLQSLETATAQEVVASTRTHKSTISRAVAALERRGLIERQGSRDDGREMVLKLTGDGKRLMGEILPLVRAEEAALTGALSARQRKELLDLLGSLEAALGLDREETTS